MCCQQRFSEVTKTYLCRFYEVLDTMIAAMSDVQHTDSLSHAFIKQMIPHHEAAIAMSRNLLQYTTLVPLQEIAQNIIKEQTKSIENMQSLLPQCSTVTNSPQDLCLYDKRFHQISRAMFTQMQRACSTNDINANFMREMIPHHEGAIRMSRNACCYPVCPELVPILQSIIQSQQEGVCKMQRLLRSIGAG